MPAPVHAGCPCFKVTTPRRLSPPRTVRAGRFERFLDGPLHVIGLPSFPALVRKVARTKSRSHLSLGYPARKCVDGIGQIDAGPVTGISRVDTKGVDRPKFATNVLAVSVGA